jgi:hypothetical protein
MPSFLREGSLPIHHIHSQPGERKDLAEMNALSTAVVCDQNALIVLESYDDGAVGVDDLSAFLSRVRLEFAEIWHVLILDPQSSFHLQRIPSQFGAYIVHRGYSSKLLRVLFEQCVDGGECSPDIQNDLWLALCRTSDSSVKKLVHIVVVSDEERKVASQFHPQALIYQLMFPSSDDVPFSGLHRRTLSRKFAAGLTMVWDQTQWKSLVKSRQIEQCFRCLPNGTLETVTDDILQPVLFRFREENLAN